MFLSLEAEVQISKDTKYIHTVTFNTGVWLHLSLVQASPDQQSYWKRSWLVARCCLMDEQPTASSFVSHTTHRQTATDSMMVFILQKITGNELSFEMKYNVTNCALPHREDPPPPQPPPPPLLCTKEKQSHKKTLKHK